MQALLQPALLFLLKALSWILASFSFLGGSIFPQDATITPRDVQQLQLQFSVISDVHMESYTLDRSTTLRRGLTGRAASQARATATKWRFIRILSCCVRAASSTGAGWSSWNIK